MDIILINNFWFNNMLRFWIYQTLFQFDNYIYYFTDNNDDYDLNKNLMSNDEFNFLEKIKFNNDCNEKECNICLESFKMDEELIKTWCNHIFHIHCIKPWFLEKSNWCPICRKIN